MFVDDDCCFAFCYGFLVVCCLLWFVVLSFVYMIITRLLDVCRFMGLGFDWCLGCIGCLYFVGLLVDLFGLSWFCFVWWVLLLVT